MSVDGTAIFSPCYVCPMTQGDVDAVTGKCRNCGTEAVYRYSLTRELGGSRTLAIMGVNPSTATANTNDATIRRDIGFALALGFGRLVKLNPFALRNKNVKALLTAEDPVGPINDIVIARELAKADLFIAAWGAKTGRLGRVVKARTDEVLRTVQCDVYALRITPGGQPEHTLFLPGDLKPVLYRRAA